MSLFFTLIKGIAVSGAGSGIVIASLFGGGGAKSSFNEGEGAWKRGVFLVSQGGKNTKLFVEKKVHNNEAGREQFELKVAYNNKEKGGKFMLCSPTKNQEDYYLLEVDGWGWKKSLGGVTVRDCNEISRHTMGEKLQIEVQLSEGPQNLLQEVDLSDCQIKDLRVNNWKQNDPFLELTCKERTTGSGSQKKEMKLLSRTYSELKLSR